MNVASFNFFEGFLFTVFFTIAAALPYGTEDEKTFNLKVGFDLTHGENGPALRIRDFEDSGEINRRAEDSGKRKLFKKKKVGSDSSDSESVSSIEKKPALKSKKPAKNSGSGDDDVSDIELSNDKYSTRGMEGPYSAEENKYQGGHGRGGGGGGRGNDNDDDERRYDDAPVRRKRYAQDLFQNFKRKMKKFLGPTEKQKFPSTTYKPY